MKKMLLLLASALLFAAPAAFSQGTYRVDDKGILKKIEKADADVANPKKSEKPATWISRGDAYMEAAKAISGTVYVGQPYGELVLFFGQAPQEVVAVGSRQFSKTSYEYFDAYVDGSGNIAAWTATREVYPGALEQAIASYDKAYQLGNGDRKVTSRVAEKLKDCFTVLYNEGSSYFTLMDYNRSGQAFARAFELTQHPAYVVEDAQVVASLAHDAGVAFYYGGDYENSIKYYRLAIDKNYREQSAENEGDIYALMYYAYRDAYSGDEGKMREIKAILENALTQYPGNDTVIESLTDAYARLREEPRSIIPLITSGIEADPQNPALWNSLGRAYSILKEYDKSVEAFIKVTELLPQNPGAYLALGYAYILKADQMSADLEASYKVGSDYSAYQESSRKITEVYTHSVAPLERAHELDPSNKAVVEILKNVTFRLRLESPEMSEKNKKYDELLRTM